MGGTGRVIVAITTIYLLTLTFPEAEGYYRKLKKSQNGLIGKDYRKAERKLMRAQKEKESIWAELESTRGE